LCEAQGVFIPLWMVPYPLAIYDPVKRTVSFSYGLVSQLLGVGFESRLYAGQPPGLEALRATGLTYLAVDGLGLLLLTASYFALHLLKGGDLAEGGSESGNAACCRCVRRYTLTRHQLRGCPWWASPL
jgi:hypothetical protein